MARPDKEAAVAELADRFRSCGAVLLTEYRGMSVADLETLRRSLAGNAQYAVVKNTLTAIAARRVGLETFAENLQGPTALAFVTGEPVEAAKALRDFAKDNRKLVIKGGVMDGNVMNADEVDALACCSPRLRAPSRRRCPRPRVSSRHPPPRRSAPSTPCARSGPRPDLNGRARHPHPLTPIPAPAGGHRLCRLRHHRRCRPVFQEGTPIMAKLTTDELIEAFKELTLIELSEFVKAFEETFDVTAAAPAAAVVAAAPAAAGEAAAEEEKDEFDVVLEAAGDKKIQVIKEVRTLTSLGLKEAKELVDGAPKPVLEGANKEAAEKAKAQLEGVGATVTLA